MSLHSFQPVGRKHTEDDRTTVSPSRDLEERRDDEERFPNGYVAYTGDV
jgi:hypothetical protein